MTDDLKRALERLREPSGLVSFQQFMGQQVLKTVYTGDISKPLAALIRDVSGDYGVVPAPCGACGSEREHAPDCALVALVNAINGEGP